MLIPWLKCVSKRSAYLCSSGTAHCSPAHVQVRNIVDKATKELSMEKTLKELDVTWAQMEFDHEPHHRTSIMLINASEELIETLEDNQVYCMYVGMYTGCVCSLMCQCRGQCSEYCTQPSRFMQQITVQSMFSQRQLHYEMSVDERKFRCRGVQLVLWHWGTYWLLKCQGTIFQRQLCQSLACAAVALRCASQLIPCGWDYAIYYHV